jgi:hypothetical protein
LQTALGMINVVVDEEGKDAETVAKELEAKKVMRGTQKMSEAQAEMILHVEGGQLSPMHLKDLMGIWDTLKSVHHACGFATSLVLHQKFLTMKKGANQLMQSWIGEIQKQAFMMKEAEIMVSDQDIILMLTIGLPSSYDAVIINFNSTPADQLILNNVIAHLLNEETRQTTAAPTKSTSLSTHVKTDPDKAAYTATPANCDHSKVTCHFCSEKGILQG